MNVLKIASGPGGAESNGVYVLTEERTIFNRANDREVVVFFQWDGVAGPHKLVAQWRSPDGGLTIIVLGMTAPIGTTPSS